MIKYDYARDDWNKPEGGYRIIDRKTGKVVDKAKTKNGAHRAIDNHDNKYGGYKHYAEAIYGDAKPKPQVKDT